MLGGARGFVRFLEDIFLAGAVVEFARRRIERNRNLLAGLVSRGGDGFEYAVERFFVGFQVGREAAFVAHGGGVAVLFQHGFQMMEHFDAPAERFVKTGRAERHDHEFLHVHGVVGVRAAIQDVHHRHGKRVRGGVARIFCEIFVERLARRRCRRARGGHRDGENGVGAKFRFVRRAVGFDHAAIERALVGGIHAGDRFRDVTIDVSHGFQHALAEVMRFVTVAELDGLVLSGGSARRDGGAPDDAAFEADVSFDRGIAARIENLAAVNRDDFRGHHSPLRVSNEQ